MPLLNYTTKVDAEKTVGEIQQMLAKSGANKIMTEYDGEGSLVSLAFSMSVDGNTIGFQLPTDWRPVLAILQRQRVEPRFQTQEQALKVAWRITKDWIEAQLAIIETKMVKPEQVFLPYMVQSNGRTLYENAVESKFLIGQPK